MHKPALLILFFLLVLHYIYMPREVYAQTASKSASVSANGNTLGLFEDIFAALSSILSKHPINKDLNRDNDGFLPAGLLADNFTLPSSSSASNRVAGTEDTNAVADTAYQYSVARSVSIPEETSSSKQTFFQKIFSFFQDLFGGIIETGNESATQYASRQVPAGVAEIHMNETAKGNMPANDISSLPILGEAADNMAMAKALDFSRCANLPPGPDFCEGGWVGGVEKTEPTPTATPTPANGLPPEDGEPGTCSEGSGWCAVPTLMPFFKNNEYIARQASQICQAESGSDRYVVNDGCLSGRTRDFSVGLFQINMLAHLDTLINLELVPDNCRGFIVDNWEGDKICAIYDDKGRQLFDEVAIEKRVNECIATMQTAANNINYAKRLSNDGTNWNLWSTARLCNI